MEEIAHSQDADNKSCLRVYEAFIAAGNECSKLVENDNNIVRIFFHDLIKITTSYVLKKNSLNKLSDIPEWVISYKKNKYPYISYNDVKNGIDIEEKIFNNYHRSFTTKLNLFKCVCYLLNKVSPNRNSLVVGTDIPIRNISYFRLLLDFNLYFIKCSRINIICLNEQFSILNNYLENIFDSIANKEDVGKIKIIVKNHLSQFIDKDHNEVLYQKYNFLIIGSPGENINRVNSILAKRNRVPVISFMHGGGDQTMVNEPRIGYSENSFVDYIIGYGKLSLNHENNSYLKSFTKQPTYIGSSYSKVNEVYKTKKIKKVESISEHKWMYVPDSGQIINNFGPYIASINIFVYFNWQKKLINSFPGLLYKKHPKGDDLFRQISDEQLIDLIGRNFKDISIINENFEETYNLCDGYIFDTVSTAFMIAVATDKPIIYFNIGKRKFTEYAEKLIKQRCLWIDITNGNSIDLADLGKILSTQDFVNNLTSEYSLIDDIHMTQEKALFSLIQKS